MIMIISAFVLGNIALCSGLGKSEEFELDRNRQVPRLAEASTP